MALHALGKNKVQTALTMLGIVIGVSAVMTFIGFLWLRKILAIEV